MRPQVVRVAVLPNNDTENAMAITDASRNRSSYEDAGKLLLRIAVGLLILFHGVAKVTGGIDSITGMLAKSGVPEGVGYLVYIGEVVAPLFVILGAWTRPAALVIAGNMVVAVAMVHMNELFSIVEDRRLRPRAAGDVPVFGDRDRTARRRPLQPRRRARSLELAARTRRSRPGAPAAAS